MRWVQAAQQLDSGQLTWEQFRRLLQMRALHESPLKWLCESWQLKRLIQAVEIVEVSLKQLAIRTGKLKIDKSSGGKPSSRLFRTHSRGCR